MNNRYHRRKLRASAVERKQIDLDQALTLLLSAGTTPPNAGELVMTDLVAHVLDELRERFSTVLTDAPPSLQVGDAMALSSKVDGVFVVTRMNVVRRPMVRELRRALDTSPATKLGFVVTGAEAEETYGYGGAYHHAAYGETRERAVRT